MNLTGRARELGLLRTWFDGQEPSLVRVWGPPGVGKTAVVREAARDFPVVYHRCPPLPDPSQRSALAATLRGTPLTTEAAAVLPQSRPPSWEELFSLLEGVAAGPSPTLLILDDAHRLTEARSRVSSEFRDICARRIHPEASWHLVMAGRPGLLPTLPGEDAPAVLDLPLPTLSFRSVLALLPGASPREKLESYSVFGGNPGILGHVDPQTTLNTNVRRLLLDGDGPLTDWGTSLLERELQTPSRYAAILSALSAGESTWSTVHAGVADLTTSGQVAPYLNRLVELGWVEVRRSLDARPKSRNRRYRIMDPFLSFWYRLADVTRWRFREDVDPQGRPLREVIQAQAAAVFPDVCRQFMTHDAMELLGHNARECGSLWSAHDEIAVAGILRSGGAFYGSARWGAPHAAKELRALDAAIRETRYGFGREARLRLLFSTDAPLPDMEREAARRHDTLLVSVADLAGIGA